MVLEQLELKRLVSDGVRKTVNKFREQPHIFFSEMDIHAYLYHCLYSSKLEARSNDGIPTTCLHTEYPTNFRYSKETMEDYGLNKKGRRGNFDFVILNPQFITAFDILNIRNKNIRDVEGRRRSNEMFRRELIAAIELKYVISNNKQFIDDIEKDRKKLSLALKYQNFEAYNLVFCNHRYYYMSELKEVVKNTNQSIKSLLVTSYYINSKKVTPKPITNGWISQI
jgi:hypothetical protein